MADPIKEAFRKVKQDILSLNFQISKLTQEIYELKRTLIQTDTQTDRQINQTQPLIQTDTQTVPQEVGGPKSKNLGISTGNQGVQTDRQTLRQTDKHEEKFALDEKKDNLSKIKKVAEIVNSLDALKKDLRKQFKQLTPQEMLIFSTIYQLEEENNTVDYSSLSKKTKLSESSIRDYVQKIIKKGAPLVKSKENNKHIILSIPLEFKRMASLDTIIALRNL